MMNTWRFSSFFWWFQFIADDLFFSSSSSPLSEAALLVFSLNSLESFHCISQHLLEILSLAENAKIFLVGNKCDLHHEVTDSVIELFLEQFSKFDGVYKISCKTNEGVHEMFYDIAEKLASMSYKNNMDAFRLHSIDNSYCNGSSTKDFCCK